MKNTLSTVIVLLAVAASAFADTGRGSQTLALFGGLGFSSSKFDMAETGGDELVADGGGTWGGQYVYFFKDKPVMGIGIDAFGTNLDDRKTLSLVRGAEASSYLHTRVFLAILKVAFPTGRLRPYIFGGLGAHRTHTFLSATPYGSFTWSDTGTTERRVLIDENKTSLAVGYGIGLDAFITEHFFLGAEYRGTFLGHKEYDAHPGATAAGLRFEDDGLNVQALLLRAGIKF